MDCKKYKDLIKVLVQEVVAKTPTTGAHHSRAGGLWEKRGWQMEARGGEYGGEGGGGNKVGCKGGR